MPYQVMRMLPEVGFALPGVLNTDAGVALDLLEQAVDAGLDPVMSTEVCGFDAVALAAALAARCPGSRLGTSIVPLGSRSTAALAMAGTTVAQVADAPFLLGVGTSSPQIMREWHRRDHDPTLATTRRRLVTLRAMLDGGRSGSFRLPVPAGTSVTLLLAALGPKMTALAFADADGVIVNHVPPAALGPVPDGADAFAFVWTTPDSGGQAHARRALTWYIMSPPYARHYHRLGYGEVVERVHVLHTEGRLREAPALLPAEMLDALYVSRDGLAERCAAYREVGALPVIVPVPGDDPAAEIEQLLASGAWES